MLIRSIFGQAINDQIVEQKHYPFGKGKVKIKFPDSGKVGLTKEEVKKLEEVELTTRQNHARNLWLFSYYNAGMRISDVLRLKWSHVQDGRISYVMGKNDKGGSLKLPDKALHILDQYRENEPIHNLVFPDLKGLQSLDNDMEVQRRIKTRVRNADALLKTIASQAKIVKPLTMHLTRQILSTFKWPKLGKLTYEQRFHVATNSFLIYTITQFTNN